MRKFLMILAAAAMLPAVPVLAQKTNGSAAMMRSLGGGGLEGKALEDAIEKAKASPLGSKDNPVRADGPAGQRAYLDRLRCDEGRKPTYFRAGSVGSGPFGYIVDAYQVKCPGAAAEVTIYMDMYHDYEEGAPVPGFTMKPGKTDA